jgi:DNA mismatch repair protein MutS2
MWLDETTRRELGLIECLRHFRPHSRMGREAAGNLAPYLPGQEEEWERILRQQEEIRERLSRHPRMKEELAALLEDLPDPSEVLTMLEQGETPSLTQWFRLKRFLWGVLEWNRRMNQLGMPDECSLDEESGALTEMLLGLLNPDPPLRPSFSLDDGFDSRLKPMRKQLRTWERTVREGRRERALRVEEDHGIRANRFGEWVVPRGSAQDTGLRKDPRVRLVRETVYDAVHVLDEAVDDEIGREIGELRERIEAVEREVLEGLVPRFRPHVGMMRTWLGRMVHFDLQWARLRAADIWGGTRPRHDPGRMELDRAVHPGVADKLREQGMTFTPISLEIRRGVTVIIGANMGGKTVALRTAGLIAALGQLGFFVPAASCRMPLFPWIGGVIGDGQDHGQGLSSFGAEVIRLRRFLERSEPGLLLLDEIGRGTNPVEGAALSRAVTKVLQSHPAWTVHVTHFREALRIPGIRGYRTAGLRKEGWTLPERVDERELLRRIAGLMDYQLVPLTGEEEIPEEAVFVAEALGLPLEVIRLAREALYEGRKRTDRETGAG